ncbi:MAG TPA: hypothetical protein VHG91_20615, partial [Longimicrobium sp.]|nr:hypothetical protein [Longimicrobium sp.]
GRVQRVLRRAVAPRPVGDADRRAYAEARARASGGAQGVAGGNGVPAAALQAQLAGREFAAVLPVVQRLAVDPKGRIWIQRPGPVWGGPGPVDVVAADGAYLGTLRSDDAPRAFSPGGLAASIARDGDVQRVVVRRLPAPLR